MWIQAMTGKENTDTDAIYGCKRKCKYETWKQA